jgi:hypothetical protein
VMAAAFTFFAAVGFAAACADAAGTGAGLSEAEGAAVAFGAHGSTSGVAALAVFAEGFFFTAATALQ